MNWHDLKVRTLKIQRRIFVDKSKELTKAEYERLLMAAKDKKNERLYYLMQTIASTGLRVSEIKYVTCDAVKSGQAVINCKGKIRQIFSPRKLCKMLKEYIKTCRCYMFFQRVQLGLVCSNLRFSHTQFRFQQISLSSCF